MKNWAGNHTYEAARLHHPTTVEQVQQLVKGADRVKALGRRHSFNDIADTAGDLICLQHLDRVVALDPRRRSVTVEAGIAYSQLCPRLHREGWALPNLASLPHISVAGAASTATHGSGDRNGNLATVVSALEVVTADGDVVSLSRERDGERFHGAVVALGGIGVVTRLTLDLKPAFDLRQYVYEGLALTDLLDHFDDVMACGYSVSLFTDWTSRQFHVWVKQLVAQDVDPEARRLLFGSSPSTRPQHPVAGQPAAGCTEQQGVAGPWHERLPHFRVDGIPSVGEELQSEFFVPRPQARDALLAIDELRQEIAPLLHVSEIRSIAADELWMSPCYRQDCIALHFTWKKDWGPVRALLPTIEAALAPFHPRPHWGKLFTLPPQRLQSLYERLPDFRELLLQHDPGGKFRNSFLDACTTDRTAGDRPR